MTVVVAVAVGAAVVEGLPIGGGPMVEGAAMVVASDTPAMPPSLLLC